MTREELIQFLKENLVIDLHYHYGPRPYSDKYIEATLFLNEEVITESRILIEESK